MSVPTPSDPTRLPQAAPPTAERPAASSPPPPSTPAPPPDPAVSDLGAETSAGPTVAAPEPLPPVPPQPAPAEPPPGGHPEPAPEATDAMPPSAFDDLGAWLQERAELDQILLWVLAIAGLVLVWKTLDQLADRLGRRRRPDAAEPGASAPRWLPALRLGVGLSLVAVGFLWLAPEAPAARALVMTATVLAAVWAMRDVLRNVASGVVVISRRAVTVGEPLRVGAIEGIVRRLTLRGVELETEDGRRVVVPSTALQSETVGYAAARTGALPVTVQVPVAGRGEGEERLRQVALALGRLSPRRAPGTPVLARVTAPEEGPARLAVTVTPHAADAAEALRRELDQRLREALDAA